MTDSITHAPDHVFQPLHGWTTWFCFIQLLKVILLMNVHGCNCIGVLQLMENFPFLILVITVTPGGEEGNS